MILNKHLSDTPLPSLDSEIQDRTRIPMSHVKHPGRSSVSMELEVERSHPDDDGSETTTDVRNMLGSGFCIGHIVVFLQPPPCDQYLSCMKKIDSSGAPYIVQAPKT